MRTILGAAHQFIDGGIDQHRFAFGLRLRGLHAFYQRRQLAAQFFRGLRGDAPNQLRALLQFEFHRHAGAELLHQFLAEAGVNVQPGFDGEFAAALMIDTQHGAPAIIAQRLHRRALPRGLATGTPQQVGGQLLVAIAEGHRRDRKLPTTQAFAGEAATFNDRLYCFDGQPRLGDGMGDGLVGMLRGRHRSWLLYAWQTC